MMSDNSGSAQVGADNSNIGLCVAPFDDCVIRPLCVICHTQQEVRGGNVYGWLVGGNVGFVCRSCLAREAPTLHALLKPSFPGKIVKQTITHRTELADGTIRTMQYQAERVDTKFKDGQYRIKAVGVLVDEESGNRRKDLDDE